MKIRHGFVSNSSSSSFVIIGVVFDNEKDKKMSYESFEDLLNKLNLKDGYFFTDFGDNKSVIGVTVASVGEEGFLEDKILSMKEVMEKVNKLIPELPISDEEKEIKIITGTEVC